MAEFIVKVYKPVLIRVEDDKVTQVWIDDSEEAEAHEVLEVMPGSNHDQWRSIATEDAAAEHPAAAIALAAPWPEIDQ